MRFVNYLFLGILLCFSSLGQDTTQIIQAGRINSKSQQSKPYVILISADGFRSDFSIKYGAKFLQSRTALGVKADAMIPSYPTLTFPNHYSIVTGLYPAHHGLVDNRYFDVNSGNEYSMGNKKMVAEGKWYGGTPLWVLAEQQGMLSASFYWVASEADIQGVRPSYFYTYNENIPIEQRIQAVKDWLSLPAEKRPHMITFYFPQVDHDAHEYGPEDPRVGDAVKWVDQSIAKLQAALDPLKLPINYVFVSDHGMTAVDTENTLKKPIVLDTTNFKVPSGDALLHVYTKNPAAVPRAIEELRKEKSFQTYLMDETPAHWHYRKADDRFNRLGDILLVPNHPSIFNFSPRKTSPGKHGYDNHHPDMQASFQAWGPAFKKGVTIPAFENVNVYPMIANILGLQVNESLIDGKLKELKPLLK
jgi:predicted AlkP superfamily pyrophosphatase or phosphodiesterase